MRGLKLETLLSGVACAAVLATSANAQTMSFSIQAGALKGALDAYAKQSGVQLIYRIDDVRGVRTGGVQGAVDKNAALQMILANTGLTVRVDSTGAIAVVRADSSRSSDPTGAREAPESGAPKAASSSSSDAPVSTAGDTVKEVVVVGQRASLRSAQQIKKNADTVVDSITATDIGAFPDLSVAEALQRVAGVTVDRFSVNSDTAHFSAEPSGVMVRGLEQVRNEFNGRDTFDANSSRGLGWADISPELMSGVDTYKNQTADMIEGGIAGTVDLKTRVPFDQPGRTFAASLDETYNMLTREGRPDASVLVSDRWKTPLGEFGALADFAYSETVTGASGIQYGRMGIFDNVYGTGGKEYIPTIVNYHDTVYDRKRNGGAYAVQWRSNDHKLLATLQVNTSEYTNQMTEYVVNDSAFSQYAQPVNHLIEPSDGIAPIPAPGTGPFVFGRNGDFLNGVMTEPMPIGSWGANNAASALIAQNAAGQNLVNACYVGSCSPNQRGADLGTVTRWGDTKNFTEDASFNVKWRPNDQWRFSLDVQRVHSKVKDWEMEVDMSSFANMGLDTTGFLPKMKLYAPTNVNLTPGSNALDPWAVPDNWRYNALMDHLERSHGDETAVRGDGEYLIQTNWLDSIKFGYRYADRNQDVNWSTYNYANIATTWSNNAAYYNIDRGPDPAIGFTGYPSNMYTVRSIGNDGAFGGNVLFPNQFVFANMSLLKNQTLLDKEMSASALGVGGWNPICSGLGARKGEIGCFLRSEMTQVDESTHAAYVMLKYGGPNATIGGVAISGNIGLRFVHTGDLSNGFILAPPITTWQKPTAATDCSTPKNVPGSVPLPAYCYLTAAQKAFISGAYVPNNVNNTSDIWLPSFNLKAQFTKTWLMRLAYSRAMYRPDMGNLKSYEAISATLPIQSDVNNSQWVKDSSGNVIGVNPVYQARPQNPNLKPIQSDNFDITFENYFSSVGYFAVDLFYKQYYDYISIGSFNQKVTINGQTSTVQEDVPVNGSGGSVKGIEISGQRYFDFLPKPFDGLGVQANVTLLQNDGVISPNISDRSSSADTVNQGLKQSLNSIKVNSLENFSKLSYNLIGMYEKGPWALRLAYSWRDKFLVTNSDCCVVFPIWQMANGFLDASLRYKVSDHVELDVQGSNLLNTWTVLKQQVTDYNKGGLLEPNAWFQNDQRIMAGVRIKY